MKNHPAIRTGFIIAGLFNVLGILTVSQFFTNEALARTDPVVFSWFGQVAIILWGLAYLSVASSYRSVPWLVMVFGIEKMCYAAVWCCWMSKYSQDLSAISAASPITGSFYSSYGAGDFVFGLFFFWVAWQGFKRPAL